MSEYTVASLDELDRIPVSARARWRPIRRRLGIRAFGMNAYTAENIGDIVVEEHNEEQLGHEEVYVVVFGRARFTLGGEADRRTCRHARVLLPEPTTRVADRGGRGNDRPRRGRWPGKAFEPSPGSGFFAAAAERNRKRLSRSWRTGSEQCGEYAGASLPPRPLREPRPDEAKTRPRISGARSSSIPISASTPSRTTTWHPSGSPGSRSPAAAARNAGTGSPPAARRRAARRASPRRAPRRAAEAPRPGRTPCTPARRRRGRRPPALRDRR